MCQKTIPSSALLGIFSKLSKKKAPLRRISGALSIFLLWQIECSHEEDRHRVTPDRGTGTEVSTAASAGNAVSNQLLNIVGTEGTHRNISKNTGCSGRHESRAMFGTHQENRHLGARNNLVWTEIAAASSSGNPIVI